MVESFMIHPIDNLNTYYLSLEQHKEALCRWDTIYIFNMILHTTYCKFFNPVSVSLKTIKNLRLYLQFLFEIVYLMQDLSWNKKIGIKSLVKNCFVNYCPLLFNEWKTLITFPSCRFSLPWIVREVVLQTSVLIFIVVSCHQYLDGAVNGNGNKPITLLIYRVKKV